MALGPIARTSLKLVPMAATASTMVMSATGTNATILPAVMRKPRSASSLLR